MFKYSNFMSLVLCIFLFTFINAHVRGDSIEDRIVILVPFNENDTTDGLLCPHPGNYWNRLQLACAEHGYHLTTRRNHDPSKVIAIIAFNAPRHLCEEYPLAKKVLFTWEPPTVLPANFNPDIHAQYDVVMTFQDQLIDNQKYRKFNYALAFAFPNNLIPFHQKKLCCMLAGNKYSSHPDELYSSRREMIHFFQEHAPENFAFYGQAWSGDLCYGGYVNDKYECMKNFKFSIAYENMKNFPGYITEKIFDVFTSGCVPVYWGAPNVTQYIPPQCFIAREDFESNAALYEFLEKMPEEQYNEYLANIKEFLSSEEAQIFSQEYFIKTFMEVIVNCEKDLQVPSAKPLYGDSLDNSC